MELGEKLNLNQRINFYAGDLKIPSCTFWANTPKELIQLNSYGVPRSDFCELKSIHKNSLIAMKYNHLPFEDCNGYEKDHIILMLGCYFNNSSGVWEKIRGYKYPEFAPGYSYRDELIPFWAFDYFGNYVEPQSIYRYPKKFPF